MKHHLHFLSSALPGIMIVASCTNKQPVKDTDWDSYLGDKSVSHFSTLNQIDTNNVQKLVPVWTYHSGDTNQQSASQIQCNPLVINGVLYGTSPMLKLFALDATTGKLQWEFNPFADTTKTKVQLHVNRGLAYWSDGNDRRLFYGAGSSLYCIDAGSGKPVSEFGDSGRVSLKDGLGRDVSNLFINATSPGTVYKDLLILGTRVSESNPAAPGDIRAYDVRTGAIRWTFHTIPRPGEPGNETWEDPDSWEYTGGANAWPGMSLDEKRGVVYIPTGSATFDFYGGHRKGKNLYSDCILAIEAATGKLIWYYQTLHHDLWDRDLPAPPNLVTVERDGKKIDAVAQVTKAGFVFVLNRDTGEPLFPINEVPVPDKSTLTGEQPWPTQPVPELPRPFVKQIMTADDLNDIVPDSSQRVIREQLSQLETGNMFLPPSEKGTVIFPGFDGGAEWGGAAYDASTGLLYVNANQIPWTLHMVKQEKSQLNPSEMTVAQYGRMVYINNCMACHGKEREGDNDYPSLTNLNRKYNRDQVLQIVENGKGRMPSFGQLSLKSKEALLTYLLNLKEANTTVRSSGRQKETGESKESMRLMPYTMTGYKKFQTPEGYPANKPPWGTLTAIDLNSGEHAWQIPLGEYPELVAKGIPTTGSENYGGPVVTSGGLLFIASTPDKKFRVFNKYTGKLLWETLLPAAGFATPATYSVNGKQYIVVACGGGKLGAASGDAYVAFALPE
ncbi:MAG: pyrroloquinoline quinone-dependent dehydrogenase [Chitinophagaceae bacterium]|nr:pyrroloquinoline quinone-dependent dehydrogenase [Chitinophagaceae bacterium]